MPPRLFLRFRQPSHRGFAGAGAGAGFDLGAGEALAVAGYGGERLEGLAGGTLQQQDRLVAGAVDVFIAPLV